MVYLLGKIVYENKVWVLYSSNNFFESASNVSSLCVNIAKNSFKVVTKVGRMLIVSPALGKAKFLDIMSNTANVQKRRECKWN